ncbi:MULTISPECIES: tyrosine-type recombinase/integrase [unclassified Pseudonocardia]|uniref:tyrosine-type recombinase/integrase n=2 Tax=Pseudonocardia TaxID=1847 RepID=UPI001D047C5E|nr:tyrosine-type recombinase/integrase [Pseudonocardia sp. EC080619-01]
MNEFLVELAARGMSAHTVRSYAYDLLRWWRFLAVVEVRWDRASSAEVRDLVLWLRRATKPGASRRRESAVTAGTVNPVTRKAYPGDGYAARTVRHSNAVLRAFYEFWIDERGGGPLVNPVPRERDRSGQRAGAHHNPLGPFTPRPRLRYNPRLPRSRPRAMPDEQWESLFEALRSDRDRAMVAMAVSSGARIGELLGVRGADLDWGEQLVRVHRKGSNAQQWLPVSGETFVWLRLYIEQLGGEVGPGEPLWQTLRRRHRGPVLRGVDGATVDGTPPSGPITAVTISGGSEVRGRKPLSYDAWRAVMRRANAVLGTNWSMHDLRHTCALRMIRDDRLSLRDVQTVLGHAHLTTTQQYLCDDESVVLGRVHEHLARLGEPAPVAPARAADYAAEDMAILLGPFSGQAGGQR